MRFIDTALVNPPAGWADKAKAAYSAVIEKGKDVDKYSVIWRDLKEELAKASHDKCWYCEIKQERSDNAVDHFRPKSHYKWLAFAIGNFRYSCTYCNSRRIDQETGLTGGKGDSFPLKDEAKRAKKPGDEVGEEAVLLNPCVVHDPTLLDFNDDGMPTPRFPKNTYRGRRAEVSIQIFSLNHTDLVEKRKALAIDLNEKINVANDLYDRVDTGDAVIDKSYNSHVRELKNAMAERAELSAFARKVIAGRREVPWVDALFLV